MPHLRRLDDGEILSCDRRRAVGRCRPVAYEFVASAWYDGMLQRGDPQATLGGMSSAPVLRRPDVADFAAVRALTAADMGAVDALIRERLASDVVLINQIAEYIIGAGGKRLRPMLVLLAAQALGYRGRHHVL